MMSVLALEKYGLDAVSLGKGVELASVPLADVKNHRSQNPWILKNPFLQKVVLEHDQFSTN